MMNCTCFAITGSVPVLLMVPAVNADIQTVAGSQDWETLRSIWKMIDQVEPVDGFTGFPIAAEKGDSLRAVVDALFSETDTEDSELQQAIYLIQRITSARIMQLSRINPSLVTRMAPPWTEMAQDNLLFNFEERITTLTDLVELGEITAPEFLAARDTLLERAETWAALEILREEQTYRNYDYFNWQREIVSTDLVLERLDMSYRAALDTLSKAKLSENAEFFQLAVQQHETFLANYSDFQRAKPFLRILLMDLIDPEAVR